MIFSLYHVLFDGEVLGKDGIIIFLALLSEVWVIYFDQLRLLIIIDFIELNLLEHLFGLVILSFETRDEAIFVRLYNRYQYSIY